MRDVAIVASAQSPLVRAETSGNEVEMLMPVLRQALERAGVGTDEIGFTCSGSSDYLAGQAFSFVMTLDGVGPWPPISESHVEMDGAWALYEAWVKLQIGEVDTALVYSYGKSSPGKLRDILCLQLDPYYLAPLWPDSISLAALQARALLDAGKATEEEFAGVASRATGEDASLDEPYVVAPLRKHDCPPITDGAVAVVLAADDAARRLSERPAWIRGIDHRIDVHYLGGRDLTTSPSAEVAAAKAGVGADKIDVAELHAPFSPQELVLRDAIGIGRNGAVDVNPSGGALKANPMMAAGLIRLAEAAERVRDGRADRAVAHATSGPCLQQNLVCVLEGD